MENRRKKGMIEPVKKVWLTTDEAKKYLGCSDDTLQKLRDNALISFSQYDGMFWHKIESIDGFLERNKVV